MDFHRPNLVIHNLMLLKKRMTFRQWLSSLVQMMMKLHLLWLHPCIDINFLLSSEFACDPDSMLGEVGATCGVQVVRLCSRDIDLSDDTAIDQLLDQVQAALGASTHCSIECAPWS